MQTLNTTVNYFLPPTKVDIHCEVNLQENLLHDILRNASVPYKTFVQYN